MKTCHNIWQTCLWIFRPLPFFIEIFHPKNLAKPTLPSSQNPPNCRWLLGIIVHGRNDGSNTTQLQNFFTDIWHSLSHWTKVLTAVLLQLNLEAPKFLWQRNGLVDIWVPKKSFKNLAELWIFDRNFNKHAISEIRWNQEIWVITNQNLGQSSPWVSKTRGILRKLIHLLDHNGNTPEMMQLAHVFLEDQSIWDMKEDVKRFDCCRYCLSLAPRTRNWLFLQKMLALWCGLAQS